MNSSERKFGLQLPPMTRRHGDGSIFPYRNGFAAYPCIVTADGRRQPKYTYGKSHGAVHHQWSAWPSRLREVGQSHCLRSRPACFGDLDWFAQLGLPLNCNDGTTKQTQPTCASCERGLL